MIHFASGSSRHSTAHCPGRASSPVQRAVAAAGGELERAGFELLHPARTEPWGQTVTRLLTGDGLIVGISYAPSLHGQEPA